MVAGLTINASAQAADRARFSVSSLDIAFLTPAVAHKHNFFKEEGIEAEIIRMNANVSITATATGDIDYTTETFRKMDCVWWWSRRKKRPS